MLNVILKLFLTIIIIYLFMARYKNFEEILCCFFLNLYLIILTFTVILFEIQYDSLNVYYSILLLMTLFIVFKKSIFFFRIFLDVFHSLYKNLKNKQTMLDVFFMLKDTQIELQSKPLKNDKKFEIFEETNENNIDKDEI